MSIFSRLLKRGAEEGDSPPAEPAESTAAKKPGPAGREAATKPASPPSRPPASPSPAKDAPPRPAQAPTSTSTKAAALGVTKFYQAPTAPGPAVPVPAPGVVPPRTTAVRGSQPASAKTAPRPGGPEAKRPSSAPALVTAKGAGRDGNGVPEQALAVPGSLDQAFEKLISAPAPVPEPDSGASASDREAVMATFEELAVGHTAPVRSLMLEVRWGEAQASWLEQVRPALKSLRAMAGQIEHDALTAALDGFDAALCKVLRPGAAPVVGGAAREALLAAYAPLAAAMPPAFELDGERDRREPMVVRALLGQVPGLDPLMIDRMTAAGLGRLETLFRAKADEIAAVAGIAADVAAAAAARVQAFRRETPAALATPDPAATARELAGLYQGLEADHRAFEEASRGWSPGDREAKKRLRRSREVAFLQITIALARLGDVDLALSLEKLPFARRIAELERRLSRVAAPRAPAVGVDAGTGTGADPQAPEYDEIEMNRIESGAHAAP